MTLVKTYQDFSRERGPKWALSILLLAACSALLPPIRAAEPGDDPRAALQRGTSAYLQTKYEAALPDLEKARDAGVASGMTLYMLGYCYDTVRHDADASKRSYDASKDALEKEIRSKDPSLESYFYLANLHMLRKDIDAGRKVASEGVAAIEAKTLKVPKDGTSQFRAGKLYQDAGKNDQAVEYHRRALAAFAKMDSPPPEYQKRATETVARADLGRGDPQKTSDLWEKLLSSNPATPEGDWSLGLASLRAGRYAVARDAFERARKLEGDRGEDAFYSSGIAARGLEAVSAGLKIPAKDADGKLISSLSNDEIDTRIHDYAKKASEILARPLKTGEYTVVANKKGRKIIQPLDKDTKQLGDIHRYFVALVSEVVLRQLPLQTKAFQDGYASLVLQNWNQLWRNAHRELQEEISASNETAPPQG